MVTFGDCPSRIVVSVVTPSGFVITIVWLPSLLLRTVAVGVRPSTPSRPFLTMKLFVVPSGFVIVTV